jgi:hypothetical protein
MAKEKVHFYRLNPLSTKFFSGSQVKNIEGFLQRPATERDCFRLVIPPMRGLMITLGRFL